MMAVLKVILAAFAEEKTGTAMSATIAGLIPLKSFAITGLSLYCEKNIAMSNIIRKDGNMVANAHTMLPFSFLSL